MNFPPTLLRSVSPVLGLCALLFTPLAAQDYHVDAAVLKSGDGKSWAKAFKTLQEALKVAKSGHEIWVARGIYSGGFDVPPGVRLRGNFRSGDTRSTQRLPGASGTLLDGGGKTRVVRAGTGALLESLQIVNGKSGAPGGGGLLCEGTAPVVRDCIFRGNHTSGRGTALYAVNNAKGVEANPLIENCYFVGNGILGPGGIHTIDVCKSKGTFRNIGVHLNSDNGLHFHTASTVVIRNSYFVANTGRGICHIDKASKSKIENCLFHKNKVSLMHYQGKELRTQAAVNALAEAKNNIAADPKLQLMSSSIPPLFVSSSPLVDAGQGIASLPATDLEGNGRLLDGNLDGRLGTDIGPVELSSTHIEIAGNPKPGARLVVTLASQQARLPTVMAIGVGPSVKGIFFAPWGLFRIDTARFLLFTAWGPTGSMTPLQVPISLPRGTSVIFQNLALAKNSGNFSNLYDLRIR